MSKRSQSHRNSRSKRSYRVLLVSPVFPPNLTVGGGVAVTINALAEKLSSQGHDVRVLSPRLGNLDYGKTSLYPGFPYIPPTIRNLTILERNIRKSDVVLCPDTSILPFLLFFSNLHGKPLQFNLHTNIRQLLEIKFGLTGRYFYAPMCDSMIRFGSSLTAKTFTTSPSYRKDLKRRGYRVDGVFSPRIKLEIFKKNDDEAEVQAAREYLTNGQTERPTLIYAGRLSNEKRIRLLVSAKPKDAILVLVGDGPMASELVALQDSIEGLIVKRGMVDQNRLRVLYKAADYLVSASAFETLGMTVVEANLCGTPVAVHRGTGFISQVVEGQNGYLIDYDNPKEAKKALKEAIANPPSREQISGASDCSKRWDKDLPNLEDEVINLAKIGNDKKKWGSGDISMVIWWIGIVLYFIGFYMVTWPFNKVTNRLGPKPAHAVRF